jgi:hypothetical protein
LHFKRSEDLSASCEKVSSIGTNTKPGTTNLLFHHSSDSTHNYVGPR